MWNQWPRKQWAAAAIGLALSGTALAHHSFAMFDMSKTVTLNGTVKKLEWTNPHIWLWVVVDDGKGGSQVWGLEGTAPGEATRMGWNKRCVVEGDKVTVTLRPLKDGRTGGSLGSLTRADGTQPCGAGGQGGAGGPGGPGGAPPPGAGGPPPNGDGPR